MKRVAAKLMCSLIILLLVLPLYGLAEEALSTRWADAADEIDKFLDAVFESYMDVDAK